MSQENYLDIKKQRNLLLIGLLIIIAILLITFGYSVSEYANEKRTLTINELNTASQNSKQKNGVTETLQVSPTQMSNIVDWKTFSHKHYTVMYPNTANFHTEARGTGVDSIRIVKGGPNQPTKVGSMVDGYMVFITYFDNTEYESLNDATQDIMQKFITSTYEIRGDMPYVSELTNVSIDGQSGMQFTGSGTMTDSIITTVIKTKDGYFEINEVHYAQDTVSLDSYKAESAAVINSIKFN